MVVRGDGHWVVALAGDDGVYFWGCAGGASDTVDGEEVEGGGWKREDGVEDGGRGGDKWGGVGEEGGGER